MTPWRIMLYKTLTTIPLSGKVLDLGGSRASGYHERFQGTPSFEVVNINPKHGHEHAFDLEQPFPLADASYDGVCAINLLEHIYNHADVLRESVRVLRPGGTLVVGVPFLMFVHPSPHDYFRYTGEALVRMCTEYGLREVKLRPVGRGPGAVFVQMAGGVRGGVWWRMLLGPSMWAFDAVMALGMSKELLAERFPLGYVVTAVK
jgi:SAM-dependent methyltransferase